MHKAFRLFIATALVAFFSTFLAQSGFGGMGGHEPMGAMGNGDTNMQPGDRNQDQHMHAMHQMMAELRDHADTMDGMKDGSDLRREMRKHMNLMNDMMEMMMKRMTEMGCGDGGMCGKAMGGMKHR